MGYQIQVIIWAIYACGICGSDGFEIVTRFPNTEAPTIELGISTNGSDVGGTLTNSSTEVFYKNLNDFLNENETSTDVISLDASKEVTDSSNVNETSLANLDQDDFVTEITPFTTTIVIIEENTGDETIEDVTDKSTDVLTTTQDQLKENTTENPFGLDDLDSKKVTGRKSLDGSSGADEKGKIKTVELTNNDEEMDPKGEFGASKQTRDGNSTVYEDIPTEFPEDLKQNNIRDKIESDQSNLEETSNGIS